MHGGDIYSTKIKYDFSISVNPLGFPRWAKKALRDSINKIEVYPDPSCRQLVNLLSSQTGIPKENLVLGNGASELIPAAMRALNAKNVLLFSPCFSGYKIAADSCRAHVYYLPIEECNNIANASLESFILENHIDFIIVANPNNPDGRLLNAAFFHELCFACKKNNAWLLIDECFIELSDRAETHQLSEFKNLPPNIIILRSFTKVFAMPGLRLGWAYSEKLLCQKIQAQLSEWNISTPAQNAACAILQNKRRLELYLTKSRTLIKKERAYLSSSLKKLGFMVPDSEANFILFKETKKKGELYNQLREKKILIRDCSDFEGLSQGYYRICIKKHRHNKYLVNKITELILKG